MAQCHHHALLLLYQIVLLLVQSHEFQPLLISAVDVLAYEDEEGDARGQGYQRYQDNEQHGLSSHVCQ